MTSQPVSQHPDPIHRCIDDWHRYLAGRLDGGLDSLLREDCVFYSPIVFTAQNGREVTKLYLAAAAGTIGGGALDQEQRAAVESSGGGFRYSKQILHGHHAMLEFETTMEGKYVNGVDIITCDDQAMITEFKVMIRPLQAINLVHQQMMAMLATLEPGPT